MTVGVGLDMKFVVLFGPQAVGKMTVGQESTSEPLSFFEGYESDTTEAT